MPHAMTEGFTVEETQSDAATPSTATRASLRMPSRQHDSETPNERAMRAATAARRGSEPQKRQQG